MGQIYHVPVKRNLDPVIKLILGIEIRQEGSITVSNKQMLEWIKRNIDQMQQVSSFEGNEQTKASSA